MTTTPTREQVVQWIGQTNIAFDYLCLSEDDSIEYEYFATLARADLEATVEQQAIDYNRLVEKCGEAMIELKATIAEQAAKIDLLHKAIDAKSVLNLDAEKSQLRQQLAAEQAHIEQLHAALHNCASKLESQVVRNPDLPPYYIDVVKESFVALSIPSSADALREYGAKLVERIADGCELSTKLYLRAIADKIRKGVF